VKFAGEMIRCPIALQHATKKKIGVIEDMMISASMKINHRLELPGERHQVEPKGTLVNSHRCQDVTNAMMNPLGDDEAGVRAMTAQVDGMNEGGKLDDRNLNGLSRV
jgi:hypothetical protein